MGEVLYVSVLLPEGHADAALSGEKSGEPDEAHASRQQEKRAKFIETIERPTLDMVVKQLAVHQAEGRICGKPLFTSAMSVSGEGRNGKTLLEKAHLIQFICYADQSGEVVDRLIRIGLGDQFGYGSINMMETAYHKSQPFDVAQEKARPANSNTLKGKSTWSSSKLRIEKYVRQVKAGTKFSFDYGMLILIASILAGVGLASDNTVVIVASMLVSPMMGPVLAVTLGTSINRWDLVRNGLETGLMTFMEILAVGAILGIICAALPGYDIATYWPTHEMSSRGEPLGLLVGLAIALASGIGVALSGLSENSSSLVGVAISASLLPPCVNTGMCWTYSLFGEQIHGSHVRRTYFFNIGYISLCLTLLNIASIFVTGFLVFRTKASLKFDTYTKDLAAAREYYQTVRLPKPKSKKSADVDLSSPLPTHKAISLQSLEDGGLGVEDGGGAGSLRLELPATIEDTRRAPLTTGLFTQPPSDDGEKVALPSFSPPASSYPSLPTFSFPSDDSGDAKEL